MAYDIYISNKAEQDLDEIYNYYLTEFSHSSAQKVIESLQSAISILEISPEGLC
ncbi:type II toxin-antitoxin system RelE/ParE family toxin [Streptococcus equi]|uniref:type II toxin-antitoxin system RelE/ParE family toxin n=1 Tax=Streptococcus equi TaxID=1336 RepID=UPI001E2EE404|nr:type II toxin-antitoxin system RelE/ParE family toxin [Streptococcus equi]